MGQYLVLLERAPPAAPLRSPRRRLSGRRPVRSRSTWRPAPSARSAGPTRDPRGTRCRLWCRGSLPPGRRPCRRPPPAAAPAAAPGPTKRSPRGSVSAPMQTAAVLAADPLQVLDPSDVHQRLGGRRAAASSAGSGCDRPPISWPPRCRRVSAPPPTPSSRDGKLSVLHTLA